VRAWLGALARLPRLGPPDLVDHLRRVAAELCDRAAEMVEHDHDLDYISQNPVAQPQWVAEDTTQFLTSAPTIGLRPIQAATLLSPDERGTLVPGGRVPDNRQLRAQRSPRVARDAANHAKRMTTDHPAREDAAPVFWQTDTGSMLVIRVPPWDSQAMGANAAASPGSISTSIRSRHAALDRMRSRTCRTTFLEGG
jgi:hypothetical protein